MYFFGFWFYVCFVLMYVFYAYIYRIQMIHVCDCVHACMCLCECVHACVYVYMHACVCVCVCVNVCMCVYNTHRIQKHFNSAIRRREQTHRPYSSLISSCNHDVILTSVRGIW